MKTVIYADILFIINLMMNYLLLRAAAAFLRTEFKPLRFLSASASGGVFSLIILVRDVPDAVVSAGKILFLVLCVFVAFRPKTFKEFVRFFAAFFAVNVIFAGVMAVLCFFVFPQSVMYSNGIAYFDVDILTLTVVSVVCYAAVTVISKATAARAPENKFFTVSFECEGKTVFLKALYDTGNSLRESFSGRPVIIAVKADVTSKSDISGFKNYRLIPYSSLGGAGLLESFNADKVTIENAKGKYTITDIYIALTDKKIFGSGFNALLGTPVVDLI